MITAESRDQEQSAVPSRLDTMVTGMPARAVEERVWKGFSGLVPLATGAAVSGQCVGGRELILSLKFP